MNDYSYLYDGVLAQLKETATTIFNLFSNAYELLNKDVDKAEKDFLDIIVQGEYVIKPMAFYNDKFLNIKKCEDIFYVIQILSLLIKASHNLFVILRHNKNESLMPYYLNKKMYYQGVLYFYYHLALYKEVEEKIRNIIDLYYKEVDYSRLARCIGDVLFFNFMTTHDLYPFYLAYHDEDYKEEDFNELRSLNLNEINQLLKEYQEAKKLID